MVQLNTTMLTHTFHCTLPRFEWGKPIDDDTKARYADYFALYSYATLDTLSRYYSFGCLRSGHFDIACHHWLPIGAAPRATVFVVHGLFDHVGLYLPLVQRLLENNYAVFAFDLPEHGLSSGTYGTIHQFGDYTSVFHTLLGAYKAYSGIPAVCVAQSTGGAVALQHILQNHRDQVLQKAVMFAPLIRPTNHWKVRLLHALLKPFTKHIPRHFTVNSHDPAFCRFLKFQDPLQARTISVNWVAGMLKWARQFKHYGASNFPLAVVQGTADMTVDRRYNLAALKKTFLRVQIKEISGARHHIVGESDTYREAAFETMLSFLAECRNSESESEDTHTDKHSK